MSLRVVVLISGSGSNLQALLDASASGALGAEIVCVISNRPDAYGLTRAAAAGVPSEVVSLRSHGRGPEARAAFERALAEAVAAHEPDLIVLAGWMLVLSPAFLDRFPGRVINLHPALPGQLPGTRAIERAYEEWRAGQRDRSGVMVHEVIPEIDAGPVLGFTELAFVEGEDLDAFARRVHAAEHALLVEVVTRLAARHSTRS